MNSTTQEAATRVPGEEVTFCSGGCAIAGTFTEAAMAVLRELCASPAFTALVLTEVNPTHDPAGELLGRYLDGVTAALAEPARDR